jgi:hypothetical protein
MLAASVAFQLTWVPGIANRYFGPEAHHFAVISGPGPVRLQSILSSPDHSAPLTSKDQDMTHYQSTARRAASAAALLVAAGLALAGCKSSTSASGTGSSPQAGATSSAASSGSGGSNSGGGSSTGGGSQTSSSVGTSYFPIALGNTWVYRTQLSGGSRGTATNKVVGVVPAAGGQRVTMAISTNLVGKSQPITVTYLFRSDGSITIPFTQFGSGVIKIKSGSIVWPSAADLSSGQPHHSTLVFDSTIVGHTTHGTAHITVQGEGSQSVTVPAGTYHANVINETISEKVEGIAISLRLRTWVADGVGPVKSDLLTKSGAASVPGTVEELLSFKKG